MECTIYLAEGCNLKCTYCYEGIDKKTGKMDIRTFDQTLAFIMKNRVENDKIHIVISAKIIFLFIVYSSLC